MTYWIDFFGKNRRKTEIKCNNFKKLKSKWVSHYYFK